VWTATGLENRGDRKVGGSTPQLSTIFRMVGREVRHRVASAATPQGYGGSIPSPSAMDGWQSGNAARWKRAEPTRVRTFDPCTVRQNSRMAQPAERRALNSEVPRANRGAAATAPSSNGRTPSFGVGDAGSNPAGAATRARSPIGRRRQAEILDSAGSNPAARTSAALAQPVEAPRSKRGLSRFESGVRHQGFLSPQAVVTRPTAKQGRGVDQFESGGTHHLRLQQRRLDRAGAVFIPRRFPTIAATVLALRCDPASSMVGRSLLAPRRADFLAPEPARVRPR
jgi:hypothetical protein